MATPLVIDTSNNDPITEPLLRRSGAVALISKATEVYVNAAGAVVRFLDATYAGQRKVAHDVGVPFGSFEFLHINPDVDQAKVYIDYAQPRPGDLAPVVDCEVTDGEPIGKVAARCLAALVALEALGYTGKGQPILYSDAAFLKLLYAAEPRLKKYRVWEASYPGRFTRWFPSLAALRYRLNNGVTVVLWQWTSVFAVGGRSFDCSALLVSLDSLRIPVTT